jgi:hypothetical protein
MWPVSLVAGGRRDLPTERRRATATPVDRRLAYAWDGLTAVQQVRTLWLLLLPFMLVNAAFFIGVRISSSMVLLGSGSRPGCRPLAGVGTS